MKPERARRAVAEASPTLLIVCAKSKCPRTKRVPRESHDPRRAVKIEMFCPWHERAGDKTEHVIYFDDGGNEVMWGDDEN